MATDCDDNWQILHSRPLLALNAGFLERDEAASLQATLERDIPWDSPSIRLYGRHHSIPRSQCWMGDAHISYRYSGRTFQPTPWHPAVAALLTRIQAALRIASFPVPSFNSVLLNRYAHGDQRMGWHSDDEPELGESPVIAALSLGYERPLRFRDKHLRPRQAFNVWLPHGSLLLMGPGSQTRWQHALAPRKVEGVRISLTFRRIV